MVSCLTVTLAVGERLAHLKRSLETYCRQSYACRELVLVIDGGNIATRLAIRRAVDDLDRSDIRIVETHERLTLGALRNVAVNEARGDILCTWDDDDFHHPKRLERQVDVLREQGGLAVCMTEIMQFFPAERRLFLTNWVGTPLKGAAGTLMWRKSARASYPEEGPDANIGEDLVVVAYLQSLGGYHFLQGAPHLYVYVSHGQNTCGDDHHRMIARELGVSKRMIQRREAELRAGLTAFDFGPGDLTVEGANGTAFVIEA